MPTLRVILEVGRKKVFACAADWPGLARAGKSEEAAVAALLAAVPRYAPIAERAGEAFPLTGWTVEEVERTAGDATTDFGAPGIPAADDRRPLSAAEAARHARLVAAAWAVFDEVIGRVPEALALGPRGGGRSRSKLVEHVEGGESAYCGVMGIEPGERRPTERRRAAILGTLDAPSDGSALGGKRWPPRYAARRIAWHVLDHAWEAEDRSVPGP